jgi:predicted ATPase/class 3 adenylate cyclase
VVNLPSGTVTLVFTDVVRSTDAWEREPDVMRARIEQHDSLAPTIVTAHHGHVVKERGEGDSLFLVFSNASDAVLAAIQLREAIREIGLEIRISIHSAELTARDADYRGPSVNRCARLRAAANPGQILVSQSAASLSRGTPGVILVEHGSHRLKDLLTPEEIFEATTDGVHGRAPLAVDYHPNNLPTQFTSFVGRAADRDSIVDLVAKHAVVTISGTGGTGKTRMALEIGSVQLDQFRDGVFFVDLVASSTPDEVDMAFISALQLGDDGPWKPKLKGRQILLLVDNCEHVLAAVRSLVRELLLAAPNLKVLATSREPLRLASEAEYRLRPLSLPVPDTNSVAVVLESEAAQLLLERAQAKAPEFTLNDANARDFAELCRRTDGVPLALELVAPKLRMETPGELVERLIRGLQVKNPGEPGRHYSMEESIEWSFQTLSPQEQLAFAYLGIFRTGWTVRAAVTVLSGLDIDGFEAVERLYDASLMIREEGVAGEPRYRYLEPIRPIAESKLRSSGQHDAAAAQLFRWASGFVELLSGSGVQAEQRDTILRFQAEEENLRRAAEYRIGYPVDTDLLDFAYYYGRLQLRTGKLAEIIPWLERVTEGAVASPLPSIARLRNLLGAMLWNIGNLPGAAQQYHLALEHYRKLEDSHWIAVVLNNLAILASTQGQFAKAESRYAEALNYFPSTSIEGTKVRMSLASMYADSGNFAESHRLNSQVAREFHRQGGFWNEHRAGIAIIFYCLVDNRWSDVENELRELVNLPIEKIAPTGLLELSAYACYRQDWMTASKFAAAYRPIMTDGAGNAKSIEIDLWNRMTESISQHVRLPLSGQTDDATLLRLARQLMQITMPS